MAKGIYYGGKNGNGTYQTIINYFPPHENYYECFLGSGAIINSKKLAAGKNIGIEFDAAVIDKFVYKSGITVLNDCAISYLNNFTERNHDNSKNLIYLDPPYPLSSRKSNKPVYNCELTDDQHIQLLKIIRGMRSMIAISTYKNQIYERYLKGWNVIQFESMTRHGLATEYLYMNYPQPDKLHEYTFLGTDFIDRQRIKRKIKREINKLRNLPVLERNAVLEGIYGFNSDPP